MFLRFLRDELSLGELRNFVLQTAALEHELETDVYVELLAFDYQESAAADVSDYLFERLIPEREFETWRLTELLQKFIQQPAQAKELLDELNVLYHVSYDKRGQAVEGYKFLGHLALNQLHWLNEEYLSAIYGEAWQAEQAKGMQDVAHYQQQLKPIAERLLQALIQGEIRIIKKGEYLITDQLRKELETDAVFELKHPE